jgi:hypothetical protein
MQVHDILGKPICVGLAAVAPLGGKLRLGIVRSVNENTGSVTVELFDITFTEPQIHTYLFPANEIKIADVKEFNPENKIHLKIMLEMF